MGGVLLHSTRNTVTKSCGKFGKLVTKCTYNHTLYDAATGKAVLLPTTQGGLLPYGVDTFFLASSSTYDEHLFVCKWPLYHHAHVCLYPTPAGIVPVHMSICLSVCLSDCLIQS